MIPHIAQRGHSFKGAGAYYLHDKDASTAERVAWTVTRNLPTDDPERAMRCMAYTDMHSDLLKQASGVSKAGRTQAAGNVYCYSLSWHPDQQPRQEDMQAVAGDTLERLGLGAYQAVIVAHRDTAHLHVHVIVNLVHPETGKVASIRQDQRILSDWALGYEREHGAVYCREREANARRREEGQLTHYQEERVQDAPNLTDLYQQSDTGKAFVSAVQDAGYLLARGDKNRLVIVDGEGQVQNLVRQIDGAKRKDIEAKLADIGLDALPTAEDAVHQQAARQVQEVSPAPVVFEPMAPEEKRPLVVHVAAVAVELGSDVAASVPQPSDPHIERATAHMQRYEEAVQQEMREAAAYAAMSQGYEASPVVAPPGFAWHLARAAAHAQRIARWICTKPRDYWEKWCNSSRERVKQMDREKEHER